MNEAYSGILPDVFPINLDTLKFSVRAVKIELADVSRMLISSAEGEMFCIKTNRKPFPGIFNHHALHVRYQTAANEDQGKLVIEGSPFGNRYGQNVFTSVNIKKACIWTLNRARDLFDLQASSETIEQWNAGMVQLHRVDLAVNFKLESEGHVNRALTQLKRQLAGQRLQCHPHDRYASLPPRGGKNFAIVAYAKGAQMRILASRFNDEVFAKLAEDCAPILRIELRLQRPELERLRLDEVRAWSASKARDVYRKYFGRLPLGRITFGALTPDDFRGIADRMRLVLAHHKLGADPRLIYSDRTRARHKAYCKKLGIDLNVPSEPTEPVLLTEVLSRRGAVVNTPKWLADAGRAPRKKVHSTS